jgi:cation diffusion facilitator family transporter
MSAVVPGPASPDAADHGGQQRTALVSVAAAVFLVAVKLVTGLITGSLALIAEAAHSATDLVAALLTFFAVRVSGRPADSGHQYGHGKAEHLAALAESAFLAAVSMFIGYQGLTRLLGSGGHQVQVTWWSMAVLLVVIGVDASRALISLRASRRYDSAALAANALHFASDLAGSLAVLVGLIFVSAGYASADAIAALLVAVLVVVAAVRLAMQSVDVLMDRSSAEDDVTIRAALDGLDERVEVRRIRARYSAGRHFVDLVVAIAPDAGVGQAHATADEIEAAVRTVLPNTDVLVHVEPMDAEGGLRERATAAAFAIPEIREVHNVRAMHVGDAYELSLHGKVAGDQTLTDAHATADRVEASIHDAVPELGQIYIHIEPLAETDWTSKPAPGEVAADRQVIDEIVRRHTGAAPSDVRFRDSERGRIALVSVGLPGEQPLRSAHQLAGLIEHEVRARRPDLSDVVVHTEPAETVRAVARGA